MTDEIFISRLQADEVPLNELLGFVWQSLQAAATNPDSPLLLPVVATAGEDGLPAVRTMVLRGVGIEQRQLLFFSDRRGVKVHHLNAQSAVELVFYDPTLRFQLRVGGYAIVSTGDEVRGIWDSLPQSVRILYGANPAPGSVVERPMSGLPDALFDGGAQDQVDAQIESGFDNFAVISVSVAQIDWLLLTNDGNRAARFVWPEQGEVSATWRVP